MVVPIIISLIECLDTTKGEQTEQDDKECRIFSVQGTLLNHLFHCTAFWAYQIFILPHSCLDDQFQSYNMTDHVALRTNNHDPYDTIYRRLPARHHVLKPAKD